MARWFAQEFGFPSSAGGLLTSGGAMANFVGLKAAQDAKAGWTVREEGLGSSPRLVLYASKEAHVVVSRAADMLGIGNFRTEAEDVEALIEVVNEIGARLDEEMRPRARAGPAGGRSRIEAGVAGAQCPPTCLLSAREPDGLGTRPLGWRCKQEREPLPSGKICLSHD